MWIYLILISLGRVHTYTSNRDPDVATSDLTPDITVPTIEITDSTIGVILSEPSDDDNFPYMAAILHKNEYLLGAGAIVGEKWVIVTAFQIGAFMADQLRVRVGSKTSQSGGQLLGVAHVFPHPMFKQFNNDVALLKTVDSILFSPAVQQIPVATTPPEMGAQAALLVWDSDFQIQKNVADILPISECRAFYPDFELTESNICVVMDRILPYRVVFYGSPLVFNGSLIGNYMGLEANTFKPSLCSSLAPLTGWIDHMMSNETETQRLFPLSD